jgi:hypothetical protein
LKSAFVLFKVNTSGNIIISLALHFRSIMKHLL